MVVMAPILAESLYWVVNMGALLGSTKRSHIREEASNDVAITRASDILVDSKPKQPDELSLIARLLLERSEENGV